MKTVQLFIILITSFSIMSCSDNSSGNGSESATGMVSFEISGDMEGEYEGEIATFESTTGAGNIPYQFYFDLSDASLNRTFTISFTMFSDEPIDIPAPGSYDLRIPISQDFDNWNPEDGPPPVVFATDAFSADFSDLRAGITNPVNYDILTEYDGYPSGGTLEITSSSSDLIEGKFEFIGNNVEATAFDFEVLGTVRVTNGEFRAIPVPR